jgi:serine kinase of HPr protein (carbohydrate metabolism regulator)
MKLSTDRTTIVIVNEFSYITSLLEEEEENYIRSVLQLRPHNMIFMFKPC